MSDDVRMVSEKKQKTKQTGRERTAGNRDKV